MQCRSRDTVTCHTFPLFLQEGLTVNAWGDSAYLANYTKSPLRAEPISAGAATPAVPAEAASAAKGATTTVSAVAGSAGVGSLKK